MFSAIRRKVSKAEGQPIPLAAENLIKAHKQLAEARKEMSALQTEIKRLCMDLLVEAEANDFKGKSGTIQWIAPTQRSTFPTDKVEFVMEQSPELAELLRPARKISDVKGYVKIR